MTKEIGNKIDLQLRIYRTDSEDATLYLIVHNIKMPSMNKYRSK